MAITSLKSINSLVFVMKTDCVLCEAGTVFLYALQTNASLWRISSAFTYIITRSLFSYMLLQLNYRFANIKFSSWNHVKETKYLIRYRSIKFPWIWLGLVFLLVYCFLFQNVRYWQILSNKITRRIKVELLAFIELLNCCNLVLLRRLYTCVTLKLFTWFWGERWSVALRE